MDHHNHAGFANNVENTQIPPPGHLAHHPVHVPMPELILRIANDAIDSFRNALRLVRSNLAVENYCIKYVFVSSVLGVHVVQPRLDQNNYDYNLRSHFDNP